MNNLEHIKKKILVLDLETSSFYPGTETPVDIRTNFDDYIKYAKVKWFGAYSYQYDKKIIEVVQGNESKIKTFIAEHDIIVGFNCDEFDIPILYNNDLMPTDKKFLIVDNLVILGSRNFKKHDGLSFKGRGELMGLDFESNSLRSMAQAMKLETQKGDIDYTIFFKDEWTEEEYNQIATYLESDVMATKQMFDKMWEFWFIFTEFLPTKHVENLSWIRNSIASLTYKAACHELKLEETYEEASKEPKEEMGGRVIEPKYEEARGVWYVDWASLYPHMQSMFNLFAESKLLEDAKKVIPIQYGIFKTKGSYDIINWHPLSKYVAEKLELRIAIKNYLKQEDKTLIPDILQPFFIGKTQEQAEKYLKELTYALKIFLNSLYGASRSPIFEKIHTPNIGWDTCYLGQQVHQLTEKMMDEFGFETIAGDTDSLFLIHKIGCSKAFVAKCLQLVVDKVKENAPFSIDTCSIEIEHYLEYIMWPFSEQDVLDEEGNPIKEGRRNKKERRGKKKNYMYIYEGKNGPEMKILGLAIIKNTATKLGPLIFEERFKPELLRDRKGKIDAITYRATLQEYLDRPDCLELLAREYKVKPASSYKAQANGEPSNNIYAQISAGYFNGQEGVISLLKNTKCGKAGKGSKYATVQEVIEAKLTIKDIDLEKVENELEPFVQ